MICLFMSTTNSHTPPLPCPPSLFFLQDKLVLKTAVENELPPFHSEREREREKERARKSKSQTIQDYAEQKLSVKFCRIFSFAKVVKMRLTFAGTWRAIFSFGISANKINSQSLRLFCMLFSLKYWSLGILRQQPSLDEE